MGIMMNENDVATAIFRGVGEHEVLALIQRYVNEQKWAASGAHYAWGRMDAGEEPVTGHEDSLPTTADTARKFSDLYTAMMAEFYARTRVSAIGLPSAWENFRASGGRTVDYPRAAAPVDLHV
jgi:hypothetical protein